MFPELVIIKTSYSSTFGYIQPRFAHAAREPHIPIMECAITIAYVVTHTTRLLLVLECVWPHGSQAKAVKPPNKIRYRVPDLIKHMKSLLY